MSEPTSIITIDRQQYRKVDGEWLALDLDSSRWNTIQFAVAHTLLEALTLATQRAEAAEAERDRFKEHSITLNRIAWKMLEALGEVGPEDHSFEADAEEVAGRVLDAFVKARAENRELRAIIEAALAMQSQTELRHILCDGKGWSHDSSGSQAKDQCREVSSYVAPTVQP